MRAHNRLVRHWSRPVHSTLRYARCKHPPAITPCSVSVGFPSVSGIAFDGSINMVIVEYGSHRVHVLRSADGTHVRVMGRLGSGDGHFCHPFGGVIVDATGCMVICDTLNHRVEILR